MNKYLEGIYLFLLVKIIPLRDGTSGYAEVSSNSHLKTLHLQLNYKVEWLF